MTSVSPPCQGSELTVTEGLLELENCSAPVWRPSPGLRSPALKKAALLNSALGPAWTAEIPRPGCPPPPPSPHAAGRGRRLACELPALPSSPETEPSGPVSARSGPGLSLTLGPRPLPPGDQSFLSPAPPPRPPYTLFRVFHPLDVFPCSRGGLLEAGHFSPLPASLPQG